MTAVRRYAVIGCPNHYMEGSYADLARQWLTALPRGVLGACQADRVPTGFARRRQGDTGRATQGKGKRTDTGCEADATDISLRLGEPRCASRRGRRYVCVVRRSCVDLVEHLTEHAHGLRLRMRRDIGVLPVRGPCARKTTSSRDRSSNRSLVKLVGGDNIGAGPLGAISRFKSRKCSDRRASRHSAPLDAGPPASQHWELRLGGDCRARAGSAKSAHPSGAGSAIQRALARSARVHRHRGSGRRAALRSRTRSLVGRSLRNRMAPTRARRVYRAATGDPRRRQPSSSWRPP